MTYFRAKERIYVRPILSNLKTKKSLQLKNLPIYFDKVEVIKKLNKRISKKIFFLDRLDDLNEKDKKFVSDKLEVLQSPYKQLKSLKLEIPKIMGILNVTPDSFSDGGEYDEPANAYKHYKQMISEGAEIIDIGGESTRPGSKTVAVKKEISRILPVLKKIKTIKKNKVLISLDTRKSKVASELKGKGVDVINDVSGLRYDKNMMKFLSKNKFPFILMHSISNPQNMQRKINYQNVLLDVYDFFEKRIAKCNEIGISSSNIILDPGIGFGKTMKQNFTLIKNIALFHSLGCPLLLGASRKSFIGKLSKNNLNHNRIGGSVSSVVYGLSQGVSIFRVHDVHETKQAIKLYLNLR